MTHRRRVIVTAALVCLFPFVARALLHEAPLAWSQILYFVAPALLAQFAPLALVGRSHGWTPIRLGRSELNWSENRAGQRTYEGVLAIVSTGAVLFLLRGLAERTGLWTHLELGSPAVASLGVFPLMAVTILAGAVVADVLSHELYWHLPTRMRTPYSLVVWNCDACAGAVVAMSLWPVVDISWREGVAAVLSYGLLHLLLDTCLHWNSRLGLKHEMRASVSAA